MVKNEFEGERSMNSRENTESEILASLEQFIRDEEVEEILGLLERVLGNDFSPEDIALHLLGFIAKLGEEKGLSIEEVIEPILNDFPELVLLAVCGDPHLAEEVGKRVADNWKWREIRYASYIYAVIQYIIALSSSLLEKRRDENEQ
ncbi:MAG: hypothetical protein QW365_08865 [Candidatus Nezhaarchaeales archaeon]